MRLYSFVLLLSLCTLLNAQTKKGKWLFENTFGNLISNDAEWIETYKGKNYKYNDKIFELNIDFNTAYLIRKNFAIGTGLYTYYTQVTSSGYSESNNKIAEGKFKSYLIIGVPFLRYYLNPDSKSSLYIQLGAGGGKYVYYNSDYTRYYETGEIYTKSSYNYSDHRFVSIQSLIGLNHFFNEHIAFNTGVGFNYSKVEYTKLVTNNYPITPNSGTQSFILTSKQKIIIWRFGFTFVLGKDKTVKAEKAH